MKRQSIQSEYWDELAAYDPDSAVIDPKDTHGFKNAYIALIRDHAFRESFIRNSIKPGIILDLGCGSGSAAASILSRGYSLIGIDISFRLLLHAQSRCKKNRDSLFLLTDGKTLPLKPMRFDAAVIYVVLSYITDEDDVLNVLTQIRRALKPGAPLILIEQAARKRKIKEKGRKVFRTINQWQKLIEAAGFSSPSTTILRHGRFITTPLIRYGFLPRFTWYRLSRVERKVAACTGVFHWDYAEIRFESIA